MFGYFKILEVFVLSVLFQKDELNFRHKNFKPLRVLFLMVVALNFVFTGFLIKKLYTAHEAIRDSCPYLYGEVAKSQKQEEKK